MILRAFALLYTESRQHRRIPVLTTSCIRKIAGNLDLALFRFSVYDKSACGSSGRTTNEMPPKLGRPPADAEQKLSESISFRLTQRQLFLVQAAASRTRTKSPDAWARDVVIATAQTEYDKAEAASKAKAKRRKHTKEEEESGKGEK